MKRLAVYSHKGGVGKTTTTVNLAYESARHRLRTLLWDLDPQGAATWCLRVPPHLEGGARSVLRRHDRVVASIRGSEYEFLDVLPADFALRNLDTVLGTDRSKAARSGSTLSRVLREVEEHYDVVWLDCPPAISVVAEHVFAAAEALVVPVIPSSLSLRTIDQLDSFFAGYRHRPPLRRVVFTQVDGHRRLHVDGMGDALADRDDVLRTLIPLDTEVERMGDEQAPLAVISPRSAAAAAYGDLWRELAASLPGGIAGRLN